jgi:ribonuclease G
VEQTEAMVVVDVNTGKSEGKGSHEETVLSTNLEAVNEVARQLRLRNVAGLVVVDFIDMPLASHRRTVEKALKKALAADRSRCRILPMSDMGIVEMTRKRMGRSLDQDWLQSCPGCSGSGSVWADRPLASRAMTEMIRESARPGTKVVHVDAHPQVIQAIRIHQGDELGVLENRENVAIQLHEDPALQLHDVKVYAR